jgi:hypothetical protein
VRQALVMLVALCAAVVACGSNTKAQCTVDTDCDSTPCIAAACMSSKCVDVPIGAGQVASLQTAGNCELATCDGSGHVVESPDNDNLPENTNPCVIAACASGVPASYFAQPGTACGNDTVCNAVGQCVSCISELECPGVDNECEARTCINDLCGIVYTTAGTLLTTQTAGDCLSLECDGSGNTISVYDSSNTPPAVTCAIPNCTSGESGSGSGYTTASSSTPCTVGGDAGTCDGLGSGSTDCVL